MKINSLWSYLSGTFSSVLTVYGWLIECSLSEHYFPIFLYPFWRQLLFLYSVLLVRNLVKVWLLVNKWTLKKRKKNLFFSHFCKHLGFIYLWNFDVPKGKPSYGLFNLFYLLFNKQFKFEILCLKLGNFIFLKTFPMILFFSISLISLWNKLTYPSYYIGNFSIPSSIYFYSFHLFVSCTTF